jgi:hypothetical protein
VRRAILLLALAAATAIAAARATATDPPDIAHSSNGHFEPLKAGTTYQATSFAPSIRVMPAGAGWTGAQYTSHGYDWIVLTWHNGGCVCMISAASSTQTLARTVQRLRTERTTGPVGITTGPVVAVTIAGFPGKQFDGTVTGQFGHTFVPFSGASSGASSSAGDHDRLPRNTAFRIIVLNVRGKQIFFELDHGEKTGQFDPGFLSAATQLLHTLKFPTT